MQTGERASRFLYDTSTVHVPAIIGTKGPYGPVLDYEYPRKDRGIAGLLCGG